MEIPGITAEAYKKAQQIYGFTATFLAARFDKPCPIPEAHLIWWAMCCSKRQQVSIAAPRSHAKSTAITFSYALFMLLFRKASHLLILGANESLSGGFLHDIKIELNENDAMREAFGIDSFQKETETELVCLFKDGHRFRIICKGAGQRMRGVKWERKRPDLVLFDDMEDEEQVLNEQRRDKFRKWFQGTVRPIISSAGLIRGVGTIIGFDSFLERTMPSEKSKATVSTPLYDYSTDEEKAWFSAKFRAHDEPFDHILWPEQFSEKKLRALRAEYAEMGTLDIYGQEYLNYPIDDTVAYYRKDDMLPMKEADHETIKSYYAAVDLAIGERKTNAYSVLVVGGLDAKGFLHIVDVRRGRWDSLQIVEEFFSVYDRWNVETYRVESENIAKSIGPFLYKEMDERGKYLNLDEKTASKDKLSRGRSMQARMRAGKVKFDTQAEWYPDLLEELIRFPKSQFLDQADAMGWLGLLLVDMAEPNTAEDQAEADYQMFADTFDDEFIGRDSLTGY